jgi:fucose 4-O-acetylase-like acetyltransferase
MSNQEGRGLTMDFLYLGIIVLFFAISGWLLYSLDRL